MGTRPPVLSIGVSSLRIDPPFTLRAEAEKAWEESFVATNRRDYSSVFPEAEMARRGTGVRYRAGAIVHYRVASRAFVRPREIRLQVQSIRVRVYLIAAGLVTQC